MTEITLYNTRTRRKEPLVPLDWQNPATAPIDRRVRMYVCGPTVYDRAHIGNARPVVVFDVLYRLLRHVYGAEHVTYVRNITDVDDKINARAKESGRTIREITEETLAWYRADMAALGALPPSYEPRATDYVGAMVAMIEALIAKGHAYAAEGHVLFAVSSYPEYGRFAKRSLDEMQAGARVEVAPYKRDPMDFVLWKPSASEEPGWDSPWGRGRPGWHIECSAMSYELLGPSFDIHGGGIDLVFPHHENEIAQSRCAHPEGSFANIWMHNGFLNVEGEKMSKSLGNFFTVQDVIQKYHPLVVRFVLLSAHYRKPLDWRDGEVARFRNELAEWSNWLSAFDDEPMLEPSQALIDMLSSDLNTPGAITQLRNLFALRQYNQLRADLNFLGLRDRETFEDIARVTGGSVPDKIEKLVERLDEARSRRNFAEADRIRERLREAGVLIQNKGGCSEYSLTPEFDFLKLEEIE